MSRSITALLEAAKFLDEQDKFRLSPQSAAAGGAVAADVGITFSQQQQQHFINGNGYGSSSKGIANNNINNNSASQLNRNNTTSAATIAAASAAAAASLAAAAAATTAAAPANVNGHNGLSNGINAATSASLSNGHSSPRSQLIVAHDYEYVGSGAGTSSGSSSGAVAIRNGNSSEGRVNVSGEWRKEILKNNNKHTIRYIQTFPCSPIRIVCSRLFSHSPLCLFPCFDLVRRSSSGSKHHHLCINNNNNARIALCLGPHCTPTSHTVAAPNIEHGHHIDYVLSHPTTLAFSPSPSPTLLFRLQAVAAAAAGTVIFLALLRLLLF